MICSICDHPIEVGEETLRVYEATKYPGNTFVETGDTYTHRPVRSIHLDCALDKKAKSR